MTTRSEDTIEIQITEATALRARVRVCLARGAFSDAALIEGFLYGPKSKQSETVPIRHPLSDQSNAEILVGEAVIPEPCYASSDFPMHYEVHIDIHDGQQVTRRTISMELRPTQPPKLYD